VSGALSSVLFGLVLVIFLAADGALFTDRMVKVRSG
jgi:hypothetical protein